ncbi:hypothetical protein [Bradyrhizobium sp. CW9]|uniref:hypothetical protein n=1 Tax=Bradyrhizobium sp. CW9 TaxID=2782689 RepID=UPI001FFAF3C6|nr:hypothetical protein [Bradyrhizobium sp. CW9]
MPISSASGCWDEHAVGRRDENSGPEQAQEDALQQGRLGLGRQSPSDRDQPEKRDHAVADKVERVRLDGLRACDEAFHDLDQPVSGVEQHDDPQRRL